MKATFLAGVLACAISLPAFAGEPGYGYPDQGLPAPLELEQEAPEAPCVAPCQQVPVVPRPCARGCGNVYAQTPAKICQIVEVGFDRRVGRLAIIYRLGVPFTRPMSIGEAEIAIRHYLRIPDGDGRRVCEVIN